MTVMQRRLYSTASQFALASHKTQGPVFESLSQAFMCGVCIFYHMSGFQKTLEQNADCSFPEPQVTTSNIYLVLPLN